MAEQFVSARLMMARSLRGMTAVRLAAEAGVTPEWISKVEKDRTIPSGELMNRIAKALNFPVGFFFREVLPLPATEAFHFRASSRLARKDESAARALALLACELSEWMDKTYELPIPGIPEIQDLVGAELSSGSEVAADALRNYWGLGTASVSSMLGLLESKGARVFSVSGEYQAIDAFSFRHDDSAIIFLNPTKSAERLRFDLAHELGHLVLHGGSLYEGEGKVRERQANDFASAFLMPRGGILGSIRGNLSIDELPSLKSTWKVSAMAAAVRLHDIGVTSDWTYRLMCQELSRRGFRRSEPGSTLVPEVSSLWSQILADLRTDGLGFSFLADRMGVHASDIRALLVGLVPVAIPGGGTRSGRSAGSLSAV